MEDLLRKISNLIVTQIDEVDEIRFIDREMTRAVLIYMKDGKQAIMSLVETIIT